MDQKLVELIWHLIQKYPKYGVRRIHHMLGAECGKHVNVKAVHRIMRRKNWTI